MRIRFGYAGRPLRFNKEKENISDIKIETNAEKKVESLKNEECAGIQNLKNIIEFNAESNIHFYRMLPVVIALKAHPKAGYFTHRELFSKQLCEVGKIIKQNNMRIDTKLNELSVFNSKNPRVQIKTKSEILAVFEYYEDFDYEEGKIQINIGGATGGKEEGIKRFLESFYNYPEEIQKRFMISNDKIFNIKDVLALSHKINVPAVLKLNSWDMTESTEEEKADLIKEVFDTWKTELFPPKVQFEIFKASENNSADMPKISLKKLESFIIKAEKLKEDFDLIIESSQREEGMFEIIKGLKEDFKGKWLDETTLEL